MQCDRHSGLLAKRIYVGIQVLPFEVLYIQSISIENLYTNFKMTEYEKETDFVREVIEVKPASQVVPQQVVIEKNPKKFNVVTKFLLAAVIFVDCNFGHCNDCL